MLLGTSRSFLKQQVKGHFGFVDFVRPIIRNASTPLCKTAQSFIQLLLQVRHCTKNLKHIINPLMVNLNCQIYGFRFT